MAMLANTTGEAGAVGFAGEAGEAVAPGAAGEAAVDAAALLRTQGFSPPEEARLLALRRRYQRGAFRQIPLEQKRLEFARWLVQHGRLSDHLDPAAAPTTRGQR